LRPGGSDLAQRRQLADIVELPLGLIQVGGVLPAQGGIGRVEHLLLVGADARLQLVIGRLLLLDGVYERVQAVVELAEPEFVAGDAACLVFNEAVHRLVLDADAALHLGGAGARHAGLEQTRAVVAAASARGVVVVGDVAVCGCLGCVAAVEIAVHYR